MEKVYVPDFGLYGKIKRKRKGEIVVVFPQVGLWGKFKEEELFASREDFLLASQRKRKEDCGTYDDRDKNAAINLRNLAVRRVPPKLACSWQANACGEERQREVIRRIQ